MTEKATRRSTFGNCHFAESPLCRVQHALGPTVITAEGTWLRYSGYPALRRPEQKGWVAPSCTEQRWFQASQGAGRLLREQHSGMRGTCLGRKPNNLPVARCCLWHDLRFQHDRGYLRWLLWEAGFIFGRQIQQPSLDERVGLLG